jgi:hypothetical protein
MSKRKNNNKYNKSWINWFLKNKTKEIYNDILIECFPDHSRCRCCGGPIYYYDSIFRINNKYQLYVDKKSYLTKKNILGQNYYLSVCEDCLSNKFPLYQEINKTRVFNRLCDITNYAFDVPEQISKEWKNQNYSIRLETMIEKYGDIDGTEKWNNYCEKQSITNTYTYKKDKYGWTEEQFDEYNKSRSVTIDNCIKKHGEIDGLKIWNDYIDKQRYSCSLDYFIEKYGEDIGHEKFEKFSKNRQSFSGYSNISQVLFESLKNKINKNYTYFHAECNNEYSIGPYYLDFFIEELNLAIEFYGDVWHANPLIYKDIDRPNPFNKTLTSSMIWEKDDKRIKFIKTKIKDVFIVWEKDLHEKGLENIVEELLKLINLN